MGGGFLSETIFCDLSCEYASFPDNTALDGACRREISLFCSKYKRLVPKNAICLDYKNSEKNKKQ